MKRTDNKKDKYSIPTFMIKDTRMNDIHLTIAIEWKAYQMIVVILVCGKHFNNIANIDFDELDK